MLQNGNTALHRAAARGKVEAINLLVKHGAAVDIRNKVEPCKISRSALCAPAQTELRSGTERLLCRRRMIWIVSEVFMLQYGDTAIHDAARRGKVEAVKALIDCGAAVNIRNEV